VFGVGFQTDMTYSPIVLFAYCRPDHLRLTVEALQNNLLAGVSDLIVYSDAARSCEKQAAVDEVRAYLETVAGFRSVSIRYRMINFGLAASIIQGVSEVLQDFDRVIVIEDDMVTSPHFLSYMNDGLQRYANDDRVISIHGYVYPVTQSLPEAFFLPGADCWGWATWRRGWKCFNPDGKVLLDGLRRRNLLRDFDFNGTFPYSRMLEDQISGKNDSWAIRWYASAFLAGKLTLYPGRSLVRNIGLDGSGVHCGQMSSLDVELSRTPIDLREVPVEPSRAARRAVESYFSRDEPGLLRRLVRWARALLRGKTP
jgi:hypothetical protein